MKYGALPPPDFTWMVGLTAGEIQLIQLAKKVKILFEEEAKSRQLSPSEKIILDESTELIVAYGIK